MLSDPLRPITSRRSDPVLLPPGPSRPELDRMLAAAATAPDHRRLRPWRFFVVEGPAREALGAALAKALQANEPDCDAAELDRVRRKTLRAPTIVVTAAVRTPGSVPWWEQLASAAAATQNLLLAANALGYGSIWRTGDLLEHPLVLSAFGLSEQDRIVGLVHLGTRQPGPVSRQGRGKHGPLTHVWQDDRALTAWDDAR